MDVVISERVRARGAFLASIIVKRAIIIKNRADILEHSKKLINKILSSFSIERLREHPILRAYRDFMWRLGIDPTKKRPSSEALIRRILNKHEFPLKNNVIDSGNLASVETLVPIGIYDLSKIKGKVTLRFAYTNEIFIDVATKKAENLSGKEIVLADEDKVLHIFPHRDSALSAIDDIPGKIIDVFIIGAGVPGVPTTLVKKAVELTAKYLYTYANAKEISEVKIHR